MPPLALNSPLRLGIVGLGRMGMRHWQTWTRLAGVELVAVCDPAPAVRQWAHQHQLLCCSDVEQLRDRIDMAVIASPSSTHCAFTLALLKQRISCLVEKPLALSSEACRQLARCARENNTLLAVGQCERFNPGVIRTLRELNPSTTSVEVFRHVSHGAPVDSDVIEDLLVHDLDWVLHAGRQLVATEVLSSTQVGERVQAILCRLDFFGGLQVYLSARYGFEPRREIILSPRSPTGTIPLEWQLVPNQADPLTLQAQAFLLALRGESSPIATGEDALKVMQVCEQLRQQVRSMSVNRESCDA